MKHMLNFFKHFLLSPLLRFFKQKRALFSLFLFIVSSYLFSLLGILFSITVYPNFNVQSIAVCIILIILLTILVSLLLTNSLFKIMKKNHNTKLQKRILAFSKDLFASITLFFTLLLQFTDILSFENASLINQLQEKNFWIICCFAFSITALNTQAIYLFYYQLQELNESFN
ncbi:hypothetical protein [Enterococcus faecalis]|uniref:hypothetical protein n=1 Tax=Enterococcus faecalis TaxID=1351 RepID=UPI001CF30CD8|nr:hypothetical protein [Enterococcus faecalis]MCA6711252.1 hypothetical protein [Enterococcus faecalis]MCA6730102.1 hypothetical protein [Enterococcus faecalis]